MPDRGHSSDCEKLYAKASSWGPEAVGTEVFPARGGQVLEEFVGNGLAAFAEALDRVLVVLVIEVGHRREVYRR